MNTFYVAPEVASSDAFNAAFLGNRVVEFSRLIPLIECRDINDAQSHCITFQQGNPRWLQHSDPHESNKSFTGAELGSIYAASRSQWVPINLAFAHGLLENVRSLWLGERRKKGEYLFDGDIGYQFPAERDSMLPMGPKGYIEKYIRSLRGKTPSESENPITETLLHVASILATQFALRMVLVGSPR